MWAFSRRGSKERGMKGGINATCMGTERKRDIYTSKSLNLLLAGVCVHVNFCVFIV